MGHTGPRTNATPLNYHIGVMNELFTLENGVWVYHGELVTPAIAADLGDFVGGLNSAYNAQYPGVPFPPDPDSGGSTGGGGIITPTLHYDIAWGDIAPIKTSAYICETILAIMFMVPADATPGATPGFAVASEWASDKTFRQMTISSVPGDFRAADPTGLAGPFVVNNGGIPTCEFNPGAAPSPTIAALTPGQAYYCNLRNWSVDLGHAACEPGQLTNVLVQFNWPK